MPLALYALTVGAFGIGVTEFVIMGLLPQIAADFGVSLPVAGALISGYALGVVVGAPVLTIATRAWPRKTVLLGLMAVFTLGNALCAVAPGYWTLMAARVVTSFAHGSYFGVGSVVATALVSPGRRASAIAVMFTGLTLANVLGVPFGAWLGQAFGWRATFVAVGVVGAIALVVVALLVPRDRAPASDVGWRQDLAMLRRGPVLLGFLTTVLGFGGLFVVFTYVAPLLTEVAHLEPAIVAPALLVFGGGLFVGNVLGGRQADRNLEATLVGSLLVLAAVLAAGRFALPHPVGAFVFVALLGAAAFATVAPVQAWVLRQAQGAGETLAASFNIAAFNLGNALGAWAGGFALAHGAGLTALPWIGAAMPATGVVVALLALRGRSTALRVGAEPLASGSVR
jgi:MFS transporter, DHA1 family, inner membrane transport protein